MRFIDIIKEGLVQFPPKMEERAFELAVTELLWVARDRCKGKPDYRKAVLSAALKFGATLPKKQFVLPSKNLTVAPVSLDFTGMGDTYDRLLKPNKCWLVFNYGGTAERGATAYYQLRNDDESLIVLNMDRLLDGYPKYRPEAIGYLAKMLKGILQHELRHYVQHALIAPVDKAQTASQPDYAEHGDGYYASVVERDPQLGDAIIEFVHLCDSMALHKDDDYLKAHLASWIKQFVGMEKSNRFSPFETSPIFKSILKRDPDAYRRAVKKFFVGVHQTIAEQQNEDTIDSPVQRAM